MAFPKAGEFNDQAFFEETGLKAFENNTALYYQWLQIKLTAKLIASIDRLNVNLEGKQL